MNGCIVIALGGNAIKQAHEHGTFAEQYGNITTIAPQLVELISRGERLVLTHGNGPQVGSLLIQQEEAHELLPGQPMDVLGAMTQGQVGYMLQQAVQNELRKRGLAVPVATVITQVLVDPAHEAFSNPTKPVGPFYSQREAQRLSLLKRWPIEHVAPHLSRGYRRVVPSPPPMKICEADAICSLTDAGAVVIAAGGGGIPVVRGLDGLRGVEAVIDKDLAAELLAEVVGAHTLMLMTDVETVKLHYGLAEEQDLDRMTLKEVKRYQQEGHFPEGSMGPKVQAAAAFVRKGGQRAVISSIERIVDAYDGAAGTSIVTDSEIP